MSDPNENDQLFDDDSAPSRREMALTAELIATTSELAQLQGTLDEVQGELFDLQAQEAALGNEVCYLKARLSVAEDENHRLRSQGASDASTPGNRYVDAFEHLRAQGYETLATNPEQIAVLAGAEIDLDIEDGEERRLHLRSGEVVVLNGGQPTLYTNPSDWDRAVRCFSNEFLDEFLA